MVAMAAIERLYETHGDVLRVAIIVPTCVLAEQWRQELSDKLAIPPKRIGEQHGRPSIEWNAGQPVLITVINTARERFGDVSKQWSTNPTLLIVDECHRAGSESNSAAIGRPTTYTLGLSATVEREDGGHRRLIYPNIGGVVYRYPLIDALDDPGVLARFRSINLYVDFSANELSEWNQLRAQLTSALALLEQDFPGILDAPDGFAKISQRAKSGHATAGRVVKLLAGRRELLSSCSARLACQAAVIDWLTKQTRRSLVFHETIAAAEASFRACQAKGVGASLDHSKLPGEVRDRAMSDFKRHRTSILVAVRSLDEGVDVPDAKIALIAAGARSQRQRIQRFGRVLRRTEEDEDALAISILVRLTPEESGVGGRDAALIGPTRVRHHRWPGFRITDLVGDRPSTHEPAGPDFGPVERIARAEMGLDEPPRSASRRQRTVASPVGRYTTNQATFGPNGWYAVDEVRAGIGVPEAFFEKERIAIRQIFGQGLDPVRRLDPHLIHGSEIEALRRRWGKERQWWQRNQKQR